MEAILQKGLTALNLPTENIPALLTYASMLAEKNKVMNLTAITDPANVARLHFLDSAALLTLADFHSKSVIDVGTGAGFPGIPLKIMRPDIQLTLLDGLNKRLIFLEEVCKVLELSSTRIHKRAEEAGLDKKLRESFDVATARAVASLPVLCEYCLPLVKMKGLFIAMKGPGAGEELEAAKNALDILGGDEVKLVPVTEFGAGERNLIVVQKKSFTPKGYPRHGGTITKHPL